MSYYLTPIIAYNAHYRNVRLGRKALVMYLLKDKIVKFEWLYSAKQVDDMELNNIN